MDNNLKYIDEQDKSFGIAGMAISLVAYDCEEFLASVSMESSEDSIEMTNEFFINTNPNISAKSVWNEMFRQFQVTAGMLIGNVMCRSMLSGHILDRKAIDSIRNVIKTIGKDNSLEDDEIDKIYNENYRYYNRLFSHPGVVNIARDFATSLRMQRRMSASEVMEVLHQLNSI